MISRNRNAIAGVLALAASLPMSASAQATKTTTPPKKAATSSAAAKAKGSEKAEPTEAEVKAVQRTLRMMIGAGGRGGPGGGGRGGPGGAGGIEALLTISPPLQDLIKLTPRQKTAMKEHADGMMEQFREIGQQMRGARGNPEMQQQIQASMAELSQQNQEGLGQILTKKQLQRLDQVELQIEGPTAVAKEDVAHRLKLSESQMTKIAAVMDQMGEAEGKARSEAFAGMGRGGPGMGGPGGGPGGNNAPGGNNGNGNAAAPGGGRNRGNRNAPPAAGADPNAQPAAAPAPAPAPNAPPADAAAPAPGGGGRGNRPQQTPEQREAMTALFTKMGETSDKIREDAEAKIGKILSATQRNAFDKMLGVPADLVSLVPENGLGGFGGFGRGPGGPGGRGPGGPGGPPPGVAPGTDPNALPAAKAKRASSKAATVAPQP